MKLQTPVPPVQSTKEGLIQVAAAPTVNPSSVHHDQNLLYAKLLLRTGLAFVFSFAAISMSLNPEKYVHYMPSFITDLFPGYLEFHLFGIFEILLSVWLVSGKWQFYSALVAAFTLIGIEAFNIQSFDILFRNVAIVTGAFALAFLSKIKDDTP